MHYFITISILVILITLAGCIIESFRKKDNSSVSLGYFEIIALITILFCSLIYIMPNAVLARFMIGMYCIFLNLSLYAVVKMVFSFENTPEDSTFVKIMQIIYYAFTVIDAIFLISSAFTGMCFDVTPFATKFGSSSWTIHFNNPIIFHLGICYTISIYLFVKLILISIQVSAFYRVKFLMILILFTIQFATNLLFIVQPAYFKFDYSSITYGLVAISCYAINSYSVPKIIKKRIVEIASETVSDAILCFDYTGKNFFLNETAKRYYNANNDEWVYGFISNNVDYVLKTISMKIDNEVHTCKVEYRKFHDKKHRVLGSYIKLKDYTSEMEKIKQEEYRASHDMLTGLLNREFFFREAQRVISNSPTIPRYLICTDIKNFKIFNELFGSKQGDEILKIQAQMLQNAKYDDVVIGRISGDKFAMLIRQRDYKPELALQNTKKITELTKNIDFPLVVYIGVYRVEDASENVRSMYDKAYMTVKNIKEGNNITLAYYESSLLDKLMEEKNIVSRFENALYDHQFVFYLQSQIDSHTKECIGAEALSRWNLPEKGVLEPKDYIHILEKNSLIYKLDYYIWEEAAKLLKKWKGMGVDKYISVNISVKDFYYLDIYKTFTSLVEKYDIEPSKLNLEITESVVSSDNQNHKNMLKKLQEYGFKIEMDDFGSGYSSLNLLKDIEMDVLKIDMGFFRRTENSERAELIVSSIAKMAKKLGMTIVAEGIENEEQSDYLQKVNVDILQGFLFSKPVSVSDFEKKYLGVE